MAPGYHLNKVQGLVYLAHRGFKFFVHHSAYVVHYPHTVAKTDRLPDIHSEKSKMVRKHVAWGHNSYIKDVWHSWSGFGTKSWRVLCSHWRRLFQWFLHALPTCRGCGQMRDNEYIELRLYFVHYTLQQQRSLGQQFMKQRIQT